MLERSGEVVKNNNGANRQQQQQQQPTSKHIDISAGLVSLQFETALTSQQLLLLSLRTRAHCLTTAALCSACYFVHVFNQFRKEVFILKNASRAAQRILQMGINGDPVKIGIIGCGRLGVQLLRALMNCANVSPEYIYVSTRRPETLSEFSSINAVFDNAYVAAECDVIFLCCLPAAINQICGEIKNSLKYDKIVYSFVAGTPSRKLVNLLGGQFTNIIRPQFDWTQYSSSLEWNVDILPLDLLGNKYLMTKFCPLYESSLDGDGRDSSSNDDGFQTSGLPVSIDLDWVVRIMFACINYATTQNVVSDVAVDIANKVFFLTTKQEGNTNKDQKTAILLEEHFQLPSDKAITKGVELSGLDKKSDEQQASTYLEQTNISMKQSTVLSSHFPIWDLTLIDSGNQLADILVMNKTLKKAFVKRFTYTFDRISNL